jgi:hypothetical protein
LQDRNTNVAKACFNLKGQFKWCLSGTPLQNRVGELYSLVRFLGGDPYSYYFCKNCPCKVRCCRLCSPVFRKSDLAILLARPLSRSRSTGASATRPTVTSAATTRRPTSACGT